MVSNDILGLKHHTSKLREFSDLLDVVTFGFRGEALSSLCSLSNLNIVTRHSTSQHAFDLKFDENGVLVEKKKCARQQGTTVHVRDIFKNLPVRAKEFQRNIKKEFTKMIQVLYGYCLVSTRVKIVCTNSLGNKSAKPVVFTNGVNSVLDNITSVFGRKTRENLIVIVMQPPSEAILEEYNLPKDISMNFTWTCFVSSCSHGSGRASPDRQYFFVNGRPCDLAKVNKLINHTYHKFNNKQYPFVFLNIQLDQSCADVNVTPDKRTILFTQEHLLLASIKFNFERAWSDGQCTFTVKTLNELNTKTYKRSISGSPEYPPTKKAFIQHSIHNANTNKKPLSIMENIKSKLHLKYEEKNTINAEADSQMIFETMKIDNHQSETNSSPKKENSNEVKDDKSLQNASKCIEESNVENEHSEDCEKIDYEPPDKKVILKTKLPDVEMTISFETIVKKLKECKEIQKSKGKLERRIKYKLQLDAKACDIVKELENGLKKDSFEKVSLLLYWYFLLTNSYYISRCKLLGNLI